MAKCEECNGCLKVISPFYYFYEYDHHTGEDKILDEKHRNYRCEFCNIEWTYNFTTRQYTRKK